jgi:hypothetical protein
MILYPGRLKIALFYEKECAIFNRGYYIIFKNEGYIMSKLSIIREIWDFLKVRKKWWLTPIIIFLILLGALIILSEGSAIAPLIYTLF